MKFFKLFLAMLLILAMFVADGRSVVLADAVLTMPEALRIIEEEAFYGSTSIDKIVLSNNVKEIRARAFANSTLSEINLPDSLTFIAEDAFDGPDRVTVTANPGTYAYDWAAENGYIDESIVDASGISLYYSANNTEISKETILNYNIADGDFCVSSDLSGVRISETAGKIKVIAYSLNEMPIFDDFTQVEHKVGDYLYNGDIVTRMLLQKYLFSESFLTLQATELNQAQYVKIMIGAYQNANDIEPVSWTGFGLRISGKTIPHAPTVNFIQSSENSITVSWEKVFGATSYTVYYGTSNSICDASSLSSGSNTNKIITGLGYNTRYYVWVKAENDVGLSDASNMMDCITDHEPLTIANQFSDLTVYAGNSVMLHIDAIGGNCNYTYQWYKAITENDPGILIYSVSEDNYNFVATVEDSGYYYCEVTSGSETVISSRAKLTVLSPYETPEIIYVGLVGSDIQIEWEPVEGADEYNLYYSRRELYGYDMIATIKGKYNTEYIHSGISASGGFYYISACKNGNEIAESEVYHFYLARWMGAPIITDIQENSGKWQISWNPPTNLDECEIVGYRIYRSTQENSGFRFIADIENVNTLSYLDITGNSSSEYYYVVAGYECDSETTIKFEGARSNAQKAAKTTESENNITVLSGINSVEVPEGNELICKFIAPTNGHYIFLTTGSKDTKGILYDSSMALVDEDDDSGDGNNFKIECTLTSGQIVYIGLKYFNSNESGAVVLTISKQNPILTVLLGNNDVDVLSGSKTTCKFIAPFDGNFIFTTTGTRDTRGILYNSSMVQIADDDDSGEENNFKIAYTLTCEQVVYIDLKYYNTNEYGTVTLTIANQDHSLEVALGSNNVKVNVSNETICKFIAQDEGDYLFTTKGFTDTLGALYDSSMNIIAENDDDGEKYNFKIIHTLSKEQVTYIGVRFFDKDESGTVTLLVNKMCVDLDIPANLQIVDIDDVAVSVSWDAVNGATGYRVVCCSNLGDDEENSIIVNTSGELTAEFAELDYNQTYYVYVVAYNEDGESDRSEPVVFTIPPEKPQNIVLDSMGNTITLSWGRVIGAVNYTVYYGLQTDWRKAQTVVVGNNNSYILNNLNYDTKYYIWVTATNKQGKESNTSTREWIRTDPENNESIFSILHANSIIIPEGELTGSFSCDPDASEGSIATFTVISESFWTVDATDETWLRVDKTNDSTVIVTIKNVQEGRTYSSDLLFTMKEQTYKITFTLDKSEVTVRKPEVIDVQSASIFQDRSIVNVNDDLCLRINSDIDYKKYQIVVIILNEEPNFNNSEQKNSRVATTKYKDGYIYNDLISVETYNNWINLYGGIPVDVNELNGMWLKIAIGVFLSEENETPVAWTNFGIKVERINEDESLAPISFKRVCVGDGFASQLYSQEYDIYALSKTKFDRVIAKENGNAIQLELKSSTPDDDGLYRFEGKLLSQLTCGKTTIKFDGYQSEEIPVATRSFTFYIVEPVNSIPEQYPIENHTPLLKYPDQKDVRKQLFISDALSVLGRYDNLYYVESNGVYGYVYQSQVYEYSWLQRSEMITCVSTNWSMYAGGNTNFLFYWDTKNIPENALIEISLQDTTDMSIVYTWGTWGINVNKQIAYRISSSEVVAGVYSVLVTIYTQDHSMLTRNTELCLKIYGSQREYEGDYENSEFDNLFLKSANATDNKLARFSIDAAYTAYSGTGAVNSFLGGLGFSDIEPYNISSGNHTVGFYLGRKTIFDETGNKIPLFAVMIRGTNGTAAEWKSNFTMGKGSLHEGFSIATSKLWEKLWPYIQNYLGESYSTGNYKVWITGHSRGAAVGNILAGKYLSYMTQSNVFAYLFATPNTTTTPVRNGNIKNFIIGGDIVPRLPLSRWGWDKNGTIILLQNTNSYKGINMLSMAETTTLMNAFGTLVPSSDIFVDQTTKILNLIDDSNKRGEWNVNMSKAPSVIIYVAGNTYLLANSLPRKIKALVGAAETGCSLGFALGYYDLPDVFSDIWNNKANGTLVGLLFAAHMSGNYRTWIYSEFR